MSKNPARRVLVICARVLILPCLMLVGFAVYQYATSDDYSGQVTARIVSVELREEYDAALESRDDCYYIDAEYQVNGKTYIYKDKLLRPCQLGDTLELRYDPSRPQRVQTLADYRVASNPLFLLMYPLAFALIAGVILLLRRRGKKPAA